MGFLLQVGYCKGRCADEYKLRSRFDDQGQIDQVNDVDTSTLVESGVLLTQGSPPCSEELYATTDVGIDGLGHDRFPLKRISATTGRENA